MMLLRSGLLGDKLTLLLVPVRLRTSVISNEWLSMLLLAGVNTQHVDMKV